VTEGGTGTSPQSCEGVVLGLDKRGPVGEEDKEEEREEGHMHMDEGGGETAPEASSGLDFEAFLPRALEILIQNSYLPPPSATTPSSTSSSELKNNLQKGLAEAFQAADRDASGSLDSQEFRRLLEDAGLGLTPPELSAVMAEVDQNGDGFISWAEFVPVTYDLLVDIARDMRVRSSYAGSPGTAAAAEQGPSVS